MIEKNRYFKHSKITEAKFRQILRYFAMDLTASDCAELSGTSLRSINTINLRVRRRLAEQCELVSPLGGELKADESYFGPRRVRGLRGRGAGSKTLVFGLLKRGPSVYTEIVPNASKAVLQAIIRGKADIASVIHTDRWRGYDGLVDVGFDKHLRVNLYAGSVRRPRRPGAPCRRCIQDWLLPCLPWMPIPQQP